MQIGKRTEFTRSKMKLFPSCKILLNNKGLKVLRASPSLNDHTAVVFSVRDGLWPPVPRGVCGSP